MTAAAARKLQKEIDNVLKKVDDGIAEFADYWEQATASGSNQQKEKLGEELKKSINKLQRLRAQIREWIAQGGVQSNYKDKLEDARRRIENDMQRFKDFERELKTKAFSTCALSRADELELEEAEKMKYQDWLAQTIQSLNDQLDQFEADLELLGNKKSLGADERGRQSQLKMLQERHRWHIKKLELLLRAVDNDAVDMGDLAIARESIEHYVEHHQDADSYHDESLYDCFDLAEFEDKAPKPRSQQDEPPAEANREGAKEEPQKKAKDKEKEKRRKEDKKDKKKEERDKKGTGPPQPQSALGGGGTAKTSTGRAGDAKSQLGGGDADGRGERKLEPEEVKVQEDQLLSEAEEFICKICQIHVVGCSPKLTSCSHLFCGDCIAQWFAQHPESQTWAQRARSAGPERVVPCPVCKQALNEKRDLYPVCGVTSRSENLLLWRMLSSLKIMCANHPKVRPVDGRCEWVGEYGSYQKHIVQCKNQSASESAAGNSSEAAPQRTAAADSESEAGTPALSASQPTTRIPELQPQLEASATSSQPATPAPVAAAAAPTAAPSRTQAAPSSVPAAPAAAPVVPAVPAAPTTPAVLPPTSAPATAAAAPAGGTGSVAPRSPQTSAAPAPSAQAAPAGAAAQPARTVATEQAYSEPAAPKAAVSAHSPTGTTTAANEPKAAAAAPVGAAAQRRPAAADKEDGEGLFIGNAVSSFEPTGNNMMHVRVGDLIQVLEQHASGWTFARNLSLTDSPNAGWVPSWIVQAPPESAPAEQPKPKAQVAETPEPTPVRAQPTGPAHVAHQAQAPAQVQHVAAVVQPAQHVSAAVHSPVQPTEARGNMTRATAGFVAASSSQLTLQPLDLIEIVERHVSGWTYGRKITEGAEPCEGWFPDWVVAGSQH